MISALFVSTLQGALITIVVVVLTALFIATARPNVLASKLLTLRPFVAIGMMSYSLYLWHWSVLAIARWTTGIHPWTIPFQLFAIFALAFASYRWIETPFRRSTWRISNLATLYVGFGSTIFSAGLLIFLGLSSSFSLYTGDRSLVQRHGQPNLTNPYKIQGVNGPGWRGLPCVLTSNNDVGKKITAQDCSLGLLNDAHRRLLVLGNSFAPTFTAAFDDLVRNKEAVVTLTASWGASPVREVENRTPWKHANEDYWNRVVPKQIKMLKRNDIVLLISDLADFSPQQRTNRHEVDLQNLRHGLNRMALELKSQGIHLAIIHGNPFAREAECLPDVARTEWFNAFGGPCRFLSRAETLKRRQPLDNMLMDLRKTSGLIVIDLFDVFCPGSTCTYQASDGTLLYRDSNSHPSVEASRLSAGVIQSRLSTVLSISSKENPSE